MQPSAYTDDVVGDDPASAYDRYLRRESIAVAGFRRYGAVGKGLRRVDELGRRLREERAHLAASSHSQIGGHEDDLISAERSR
jgi:hypothetical protein